jgi:hypothetical protein
MIFQNLLGSVLHHVVTYVLIMAMTTTSTIPIMHLTFPGQSPWADYVARMARGFFESSLEGMLLEKVGVYVTYVPELFRAAQQQEVGLISLGQDNLETLRSMAISEEAKARLTTAIDDGKVIIMPERAVQVGDRFLVGWYELDPVSGEVIGTMETGLHGAFLDYLVSFTIGLLFGGVVGFAVTMTAFLAVFSVKWIQFVLQNGYMPDEWQRDQLVKESAKLMTDSYLAISYALANVTNAILQEITKDLVKQAGQQVINQITILLVKYGPPQALGKIVVFFHPGAYTLGSFIGATLGAYLAMTLLQQKADDPPLPPMLLGDVPPPPDESGEPVAKIQHKATATYPAFHLSGCLISPFIILTFTHQSHWTSTAQNTFESTALSASSATLYNPTGTPLGTGTIRVTSRFSTTVVLAQGALLNIALYGHGAASTYAPALSGLGVGGTWDWYTATLTSTQPYTLTLHDVVVTVNHTDVYTGDFTLVVTGTTTLEGAGHTAAPNFAGTVSMQATDADLTFGPATLLGGSLPFDASNGFALAGYTGPITITEHSPTLDRVELDGDFAQSLALALDPPVSTISPVESTTFDAVISSNLTDTYTVTVEGPPGWNVEIDETGTITATPPLGAIPGDYTILVTAQSLTHPALVVSAEHMVTTTDYQGMDMAVAPDPLITVPWGPATPPSVGGAGGGGLPGDTNNGQL